MRSLTSVIGAFQEANDELRVHRTRVFLSLLGVLIAVCAITTVTGMGELVRQSASELNDQFGGRPASYSVTASGGPDATATRDKLKLGIETAAKRYGITYWSSESRGTLQAAFPDGTGDVDVVAVDAPFGDMRRIPIQQGSWFKASDDERLAPAIVINSSMYRALGEPDLATSPAITLTSPVETRAVIVGVYRDSTPMQSKPSAYLLASDFAHLGATAAASGSGAAAGGLAAAQGATSYHVWLPPELGNGLSEAIKHDLKQLLGTEVTVQMQRTDYLASGQDPFVAVQILISIVSSIVLVIGAVGYVNLAIVTVTQRMREIGIRRTFGATTGRIFASVLLESLVGTLIAGIIGIALSVLILQNPDLQQGVTGGIGTRDVVPFPFAAAVTGLAVSVGVGLIAGIIPAIIATRVRVIDAIRST